MKSQCILVNNIVDCSSKRFQCPSPELVRLTQEALCSRATSKAVQDWVFRHLPQVPVGMFDPFLPFPERPHCTPFQASSGNSAESGSHRLTEQVGHISSRAHVQWDSIERLKSITEGVTGKYYKQGYYCFPEPALLNINHFQ